MANRDTIQTVRCVDITVSPKTVWTHVILESAAGLSGVGEATLGGQGPAFAERLQHAADALEGRTIDAETLAPLAPLATGNLAARTIHAAFDQAVCDLTAQMRGVPLHRALNPSASMSRCPLYANINRATDDRRPEGFAANARAAMADGFAAIKLAPFDGLTPALCDTDDGRALITAGLDRVAAVTEAAPSCAIMVDCHWRFTPAAARRVCDALARLGVTWFECPIPETHDHIAALKALRETANGHGMRLCGLETHGAWTDVAPFVTGGAYDLIMPDVKHVGGLHAIIDLARKTEQHGVAVSLHNPSGPVAHLHSLHVMAATESPERMEVQWRESPLFFTLTAPAPIMANGQADVPQAAGLGARLTPPTA